MQKFNIHTHSTWSDGRDSISDIVEEAEKIGLEVIGISDHFQLPNDRKEFMQPDEIEDYVKDVKKIAALAKITVLLGLEVDFSKDKNILKEFKKIKTKLKFDYFLGSIHPYMNSKTYPCNIPPETSMPEILAQHRQYWEDMSILSSLEFIDIISHPDYIKICEFDTHTELMPEIICFLNEVKKSNKPIEINTSGMHKKNVNTLFPAKDILIECRNREIPFIISSDAHNKNFLIDNFNLAEDMVKEINYTYRFDINKLGS